MEFEPNDPEAQADLQLRKEKRDYEAGIILRTFTSAEGAVALQLLEKLANMPHISPINEADALRGDRILWYREGRQDLIREIKAIAHKKEENAQ